MEADYTGRADEGHIVADSVGAPSISLVSKQFSML